MRSSRENPDSEENQRESKQNEREVFALKMMSTPTMNELPEPTEAPAQESAPVVAMELAGEVDVDQLDTAKPLDVILAPYRTTLEKWQSKVESLKVTSIEQKTEMAQAKLARLELKKARCNMEAQRKQLVEGLKARTAKIDSAARTIRVKIEELEATLLESEQFETRYLAEQKEKLRADRTAALSPYLSGPLIFDVATLSQEEFDKALSDAKEVKAFREREAARIEKERLDRIEAERVERERIAAENARLEAEAKEARRLAEEERARREAEEKRAAQEAARIEAERAEERRKADEALAAERQRRQENERKAKEEFERRAAEVTAQRERERREAEEEAQRIAAHNIAERERLQREADARIANERLLARREQERLQREIDEKAKAEANRVAAEKEAVAKAERERKAAAKAPDKIKLKIFSGALRSLSVPELNDRDLVKQIDAGLLEFIQWVEQLIP